MQCFRWGELMSLRLDGLLSTDQQQQLQAHLADCQTCREQWGALLLSSALLQAEPAATPVPGFAARVAARIAQRTARRQRLYSTLGICIGSVGLWAAAALAVLLVFAIAVEPSVRTMLVDVVLSLGHSCLALLAVLGEALWAVVRALATRPAGLLILGYAALAMALAAFWMRMVFRRREPVAQ